MAILIYIFLFFRIIFFKSDDDQENENSVINNNTTDEYQSNINNTISNKASRNDDESPYEYTNKFDMNKVNGFFSDDETSDTYFNFNDTYIFSYLIKEILGLFVLVNINRMN